MQSQTVSVAWAHGMVSSLCCWLLLCLMIPDFCSDYFWGGGIQSIIVEKRMLCNECAANLRCVMEVGKS